MGQETCRVEEPRGRKPEQTFHISLLEILQAVCPSVLEPDTGPQAAPDEQASLAWQLEPDTGTFLIQGKKAGA